MRISEVACKSALTGEKGSYRLNPYVGCPHRCAYCYASYMSRWKGEGSWGTWVHVKVNVPEVLKKELSRPSFFGETSVFISTVCDPYQPLERRYRLTRRCLEVLSEAASSGMPLRVMVATKSDLALRDIDVFRTFPEGAFGLAFSITTHRDDVAAYVEHFAPRPSRRIEAARILKDAGVRVGFFICPVLPYVTERDLGGLLDIAGELKLDFLSFDRLNYLRGHVGGRAFQAYRSLGQEALRRLEQARDDPRYERRLKERILREAARRELTAECHF